MTDLHSRFLFSLLTGLPTVEGLVQPGKRSGPALLNARVRRSPLGSLRAANAADVESDAVWPFCSTAAAAAPRLARGRLALPDSHQR